MMFTLASLFLLAYGVVKLIYNPEIEELPDGALIIWYGKKERKYLRILKRT